MLRINFILFEVIIISFIGYLYFSYKQNLLNKIFSTNFSFLNYISFLNIVLNYFKTKDLIDLVGNLFSTNYIRVYFINIGSFYYSY